ncbi:MAG TPA: tetratricopeptide repeat protein [Allosphingosinicella sp.]|nr:tetratricopeptide repeat protein [Allosphingosinicella sp.]
MGWLILVLLAVAAFAAIWRFGRLDAAGLQLLAAALLLALAGYAWQGRPGLVGAPKAPPVTEDLPDSAFAQMRQDMLGRFDTADRWLTIAEGFQRRGDTRGGAGVIRSALREHPNNAILWVGYGNALVLHAGGLITPAAQLAFERAARLAPDHPAPRFFLGLALAQAGRLDEAERTWRALVDGAPADAPWRAEVEAQLQALERAQAMRR